MAQVDFKGHKSEWMALFHFIRQYPFCKMEGAKVQNGVIVDSKKMERTIKFGKSEEETRRSVPKYLAHGTKVWVEKGL